MKSSAGRRRARSGAVGDALLTLAALGGLLCIALVILAYVCDISLIMFKTGSMSPTIPAGSLAVVQETPAADVSVGDVLTVDRPGSLPVTHRVTSVSGTGDSRTITMQGDANDYEDPSPYTIADARRVIFAIPGLASVVVWFSHPGVLGVLTLATSALVTWAFWPRETRTARRRASRGTHGIGRADAKRDASMKSRTGAVMIAIGIGISLSLAHSTSAEALQRHASTVQGDQVSRGEQITLISIGDPTEMASMRPSVPVHWQVGVLVDAQEPGIIDVALASDGSDELGLRLDIRSCTQRWVDAHCPGAETLIGEALTVAPGTGYASLMSMRGNGERWILVSSTIREPASGAMELTMRASGAGDERTVSPGPFAHLARTGVSLGWAALVGCGAVVAGLCVAGAARWVARSRQ